MRKMQVIEITLNNQEDYLNKFNDNRISNELSNYILEECRGFKINEKFKIVIKPNFYMSDVDKDKLVDMIRENYGLDYRDEVNFIVRIRWMSILVFWLGIVLLLLNYLLSLVPIIAEFILILAWLFIWEVTNNYVIQWGRSRIKRILLNKLIKCPIIFQ